MTLLAPAKTIAETVDFQEIFARQKAYFDSDATKSYAWRIEQLDQLAALLSENDQAFQDALRADFKTALIDQIFEVAAPLGIIKATKAQLKGWMEPEDAELPKALTDSGHSAKIYREPYGVTLVIGPFNGPLLLLLDPAIAAISAGNPCILATANATPATSQLLCDLVPKYFDPRAVYATLGGKEANTELFKLPFDFIFFTGSSAVGKVVMRAAAEHLTPVLLELGGQNPCLVDETADLAAAAEKLVWGATTFGGQLCVSPGYVYVHESVAEAFVAECRKAVVKQYGEDPSKSSDLSRIVDEHQFDRIMDMIDPAKVVHGGRADKAALYIEPTIVYPATWDDAIMREEIFGPVLPLMPYTDLQDVVALIKTKPRPLAAYVFSRNQKAIDYFLHSLPFGGGCVNQTVMHIWFDSLPFGGVGNSGLGSYYGRYGFNALTHAKSVLYAPSDVTIDVILPPYDEAKYQGFGQMLGG